MKPILTSRVLIASMVLVLTLSGPGASRGSAADLWRSHIEAGNVAYAAGDLPGAERAFKASLKLAEADPDALSAVAMTLNNLGLVRVEQLRFGDAVALFRRASMIVKAQSGPSSPELARILDNEATALQKTGDTGRAEPLFRQALDIQTVETGPNSPEVARMLNNLALNLASQARYAEANTTYRRALAIGELLQGPDHRDVGATLNNLSLLLANVGRYAEAEALGRRELRIFEAAYGPSHPNVNACLTNLARFAREQGNLHESQQLLQRASLGTVPPGKERPSWLTADPETTPPPALSSESGTVAAPVVALGGSPQPFGTVNGVAVTAPAPPPNLNGPGSPGASPLSWIRPGGQQLMDSQVTLASYSVEAIAGTAPNFVAVIRFKDRTYLATPGVVIPSRDDPCLLIRMITAEGVDAFDPIAQRLVRRSLSKGGAEL